MLPNMSASYSTLFREMVQPVLDAQQGRDIVSIKCTLTDVDNNHTNSILFTICITCHMHTVTSDTA